MKHEGIIDVWGLCPVCQYNFDKKNYSDLCEKRTRHIEANGVQNDIRSLVCPKCKTEWIVKSYPKTWKD